MLNTPICMSTGSSTLDWFAPWSHRHLGGAGMASSRGLRMGAAFFSEPQAVQVGDDAEIKRQQPKPYLALHLCLLKACHEYAVREARSALRTATLKSLSFAHEEPGRRWASHAWQWLASAGAVAESSHSTYPLRSTCVSNEARLTTLRLRT